MLTESLLPADVRNLATVQAEHEPHLLGLPNVIGVGVGSKYTKGRDTGKPCVTVLVDLKVGKDLLRPDEVIPPMVGSTPTDVYEISLVHAGAGPTLAPPVSPDWVDVVGREHDSAAVHAAFDELTGGQREQRAAQAWAARAHAGLPGYAPHPMSAARMRPAIGGVSVGHYQGTAGTLGICCHEATDATLGASPEMAGMVSGAMPARFYLLSNNHVLANCNDAAIGDPILQPAPADGGQPGTDTIARLARFVPLQFLPPHASLRGQRGEDQRLPVNWVDAAIAEGRFDQLDRRIHWIGDVRGTLPAPRVGDLVHMCGRATHYTSATISVLNTTLTVQYPNGRQARFAKQIVCHGLSTGGDSGAVVTDLEQRAIGLLFATSPVISVLNPMPLVEHLLNIRITPPATHPNGRHTTTSH